MPSVAFEIFNLTVLGAAATVTLQDAESFLLLYTLMVAVPAFWAVMTPLLLTAAVFASDVLKVTFLTVGLRVYFWPTPSLISLGIPLTPSASTVRV